MPPFRLARSARLDTGFYQPESSRPSPQVLPWQTEGFDFDRFFDDFPEDSTVMGYIKTFSVSGFHELLRRAFTDVPLSQYNSPHAQQARTARVQLEEELRNLDFVLGLMQNAKHNVQDVRKNYNLVRTSNKKALGYDSLAHAVKEPQNPVHLSTTGLQSPVAEWSDGQEAVASLVHPHTRDVLRVTPAGAVHIQLPLSPDRTVSLPSVYHASGSQEKSPTRRENYAYSGRFLEVPE